MNAGVLIVGAGQAGMQVAASLRDDGYQGRVTIVGREKWLPYQRPPLSKGFLHDEVDEDGLLLRNPEFYVQHKIDIVVGEDIVGVELTAGGGGFALAASGKRFAFADLVLATGAEPRRLAIDGAELDGVLYMRDIDDARSLKSRWARAHSVVVIGGGFIGLEVAAAARRDGKKVTVLEVTDRLIGRAVSVETSKYFLDAHRRRGLEIRLEAKIARLIGSDGKVDGVELEGGEVVPADLVLVGIGAIPRSTIAEGLGLTMVQGAVLVDQFARTSAPGILAVGDGAIQPHPLGGDELVRLESVQNAVDRGKTAARTILGNLEPHSEVPWFWSDQADLKLQIAGLSIGFDQVVVRRSESADSVTVLYYREGRLISVDAVNAPADYVLIRRLLASGGNIPANAALDTARTLKSLVVAGA